MSVELLAKKLGNHYSSKEFSAKVKTLSKNFANMMYIRSYLDKHGIYKKMDKKTEQEFIVDNKFFSRMKKEYLKDLRGLSAVFATSIRKRKNVVSPSSLGGVYTPILLEGGLLDFVQKSVKELGSVDVAKMLVNVTEQLGKFKLSYLTSNMGYQVALDDKDTELRDNTLKRMDLLEKNNDFRDAAAAYYEAYDILSKLEGKGDVKIEDLLSDEFKQGKVLKNTITTYLYLYSSINDLGKQQFIVPDDQMLESFGNVVSHSGLIFDENTLKAVKTKSNKKSTFQNISEVYNGSGYKNDGSGGIVSEKYDEGDYRARKSQISDMKKKPDESKDDFLKRKRAARDELEAERAEYLKLMPKFKKDKFPQYFFTVIVSLNHSKLSGDIENSLPVDAVIVAAASKTLKKNKE